MPRAIKIWLCLIAISLSIMAASQMLYPRATLAQNPNPTPTPTPSPECPSCCEPLLAGGHTIAGPAKGFALTSFSGFTAGDKIFFSTFGRARDVCATVHNTSEGQIALVLTDEATDGGLNERIFIRAGDMRSACGRVTKLAIDGGTTSLPDTRTFRWRVDEASAGGVEVRR